MLNIEKKYKSDFNMSFKRGLKNTTTSKGEKKVTCNQKVLEKACIQQIQQTLYRADLGFYLKKKIVYIFKDLLSTCSHVYFVDNVKKWK